MSRKPKQEDTAERRAERRLSGFGVSPGIAIGPAYVRERGALDVPEFPITPDQTEDETKRLFDAVHRAQRQIARLKSKARGMTDTASDELGFLVNAYEQMLKGSRLIRGAERRIAENLMNAEAAVQAEIADIAAAFAAMDDPYIAARADDIREVGRRLILNLTRTPVKPFASVPEGSILVADEMTPADTAQLNPERIAGFTAELGGAEGHTAIMARALGMPAVLGVGDLLGAVRPGDMVLIEGTAGQVIVNPSDATIDAARRQQAEYERESRKLARMRTLDAVTRDGIELTLQANVELPIEMDMVKRSGASGIGLLRTEFMFMNRDDLPSEDEQFRQLSQIVAATDGPVTIRTLDVGAEKPAQALLKDLDEKAVSALGLRGIRLSLTQPAVLERQFRAILRAARYGEVRILLPMVTSVSEINRARELLAKAARHLKRRKAAVPDPLPPLGAMIEVPGAALAADALARASDFLAIGSNDLTMYTLAIDRANEHVAKLFDPLHPAVLRLVQFSAEAAFRTRIPVSICGEMAGDPRYLPLLLGLGFRELSMAPVNVGRVKQRIRDIDFVAANRRAGLIMDQVDPGRIATLLDDFNGLA